MRKVSAEWLPEEGRWRFLASSEVKALPTPRFASGDKVRLSTGQLGVVRWTMASGLLEDGGDPRSAILYFVSYGGHGHTQPETDLALAVT